MPPRCWSSTAESLSLRISLRPTLTPLNAAPKDTSSTPSTWGLQLTSATAYNMKSSGSNSWNKAQWHVSPRMTAPETPLTSSKFTPNLAQQQSQSNLSLYGWKPSSWDRQPPSTPSLRLRESSTTGAFTPTYFNSGSLMRLGRRQKGKSASGRHMQTLLHLPRTCARVIWKRPTVRTSLVRSRTWAPSAEEGNLPVGAAALTPWCVDAPM